MGRILGLQDVEAALRGGSIFAAGGGGWVEHGRALGTAAVVALVGAGIAARVATGGHQQVLDGTMGKMGMSAKQRETWLRGVREKIRF